MAETHVTARHGGFTELMHVSDDELTVQRIADVEPVIDWNKAYQNDNPSGMGPTREWKHVARIPVTVVFEWIQRYGVDPTQKENRQLLMRLLNDPEWRYLRAGLGRV